MYCMIITFFLRNYSPILGCVFKAAAFCKPENMVSDKNEHVQTKMKRMTKIGNKK